jgi:DMSO reductase family type II enzyme heme b subunit
MKHGLLMLACCGLLAAEVPTIPLAHAATGVEALDPASRAWKSVPPVRITLYRALSIETKEETTDASADPEIATVQVQLLESSGHVTVRLEWKDDSRDIVLPADSEDAWGNPSGAEMDPGGYFDACAVLVPANPVAEDDTLPSLRSGNALNPLLLYHYDFVRGATVMEAAGRGTMHATDATFRARSLYNDGAWQVTMELPVLAPGTPVAVAVWNGSQHDRADRRYFSIWYRAR